MKLSKKALPILLTLNNLNNHFKKLYCYPSQIKLLSLISKNTSHKISRRQLNYDLRDMQAAGLIRRIRRHRRTKFRGMEFRSTLYEITGLGYNLLYRVGAVTKKFFADAKNRIKQALDKKQHPCAKIERQSQLDSLSGILGGLAPALK